MPARGPDAGGTSKQSQELATNTNKLTLCAAAGRHLKTKHQRSPESRLAIVASPRRAQAKKLRQSAASCWPATKRLRPDMISQTRQNKTQEKVKLMFGSHHTAAPMEVSSRQGGCASSRLDPGGCAASRLDCDLKKLSKIINTRSRVAMNKSAA